MSTRGGLATKQEELIQNIGQHETLVLFNATIGTGIDTTGISIDVSKSSSQTILLDFTGDDVTGVEFTLLGGVSGFLMTTMRLETGTWTTAAGGTQLAFKVKSVGNTTGVAAGQTGITRIDDLILAVHNRASVTGGSTVTVVARALTSSDF